MACSDYILFIDESPLTLELRNYFSNFKISVVEKSNLDALKTLIGNPIAIFIDWSLIQNHLDLMQTVYQRYSVPLLVMHGIADEEICIKVLESGADDFILKPLQSRELHARISAIARRITRSARTDVIQDKTVFKFASWYLYPSSRQIFDLEHQELLLSSGEYDLLIAFVQKPQQILSREFLMQITKNTDLNPFDRRIDVQISRLRQKIENDPKNPGIIKTIRNGGYMFTSSVMTLKAGDVNY
jgi:two-component system OmpR family response regulator